MANTGLGATITADAINDFFSLKPKTLAKKPPSCKQLPDNKAITAEQRRSSDSRDMYSLMSKPNGNIFDQVEEPPVVDEVFEIDTEGLDELEDASQEVKGPDHPALDVYDNYQFDHEYDENLPITKNREWIIGTIEMNQVTIIEGTTGSGKTTQVPQFILDYYREKRQYCNILVTQPRRIAAESIAKRVSEERNWPVGHLVGFQVGRNRNVSEDTRITYMTTGVLLQKMILKKSMNEYTHVILDEVHERDQDIDLAMLVVKKFLNTVSKHVKVILMSATLDCSLFSKYFSVIVRGKLEEAPVVSVGGWAYEVKEYYLDNLRTHGKIPFQSLSEPEVSFECYQLAKNLIMEFDKREISLQQLEDDAKFADKRGSVLVFLPGYPEIDAMHKHLEKVEVERNLQVLILHSQITSIDQSRIFMKPQSGKRKVILSTNIAESSITVPDIEYVIDFCLVKNLETDVDTNYQSLRLRWAAKSSLNQRRGRAGRVANGLCFRLITRDFFSRLPEFGTPEMQRCPLQQVVLHVKMLSIGDPCSLLKLALQPPEINDIRKTILLLKEIGALTLMQNDRINPFDGDLTVVGKVLGSLPVDVRVGKLLILGHVFGCLDECLIIAAALSLKSCFARPFKKDLDAYSHKMEWARWSFSDCIAALHCFREWKYKKESSGFGREVILSTNIAESSITVPDIEYVIDFCLVKNLETDVDTNYQSLRLRWAAKSSLNQRRGRAGRVANGLCFRLITRDFFSRLPEFGTPEMQRCPLQQVVLHVKMLSIGDPCSLLKLALQPPEINDIRKTILLLKEIGALTLMQNDRINPFDGDLTVVGKVLGSLPVDVRVGKLLILGHVFGCLDECLIIAAALSLKSCFARPFKKDLDAYSHKMEWARWSFSDCIAALHCFREWKYKKESSGFGREGEGAWGRKNFVEVKMMHEADQLVKELEGRLQQNNIRRNHDRQRNQRASMSPDDLLILKMVICGAFYPFYFVSGEVDDAESIKVLSGHDPFSTVMLNNVPSPGILYKEKIAALMRPCGKGKFLHFENSRCYVEFARSQMQRNSAQNPVLPAVYLAIKMRQLRMDLTIFIRKDNHEDLRRKLESLQMSNTESKSLRLGSLTTSMEGNDAQTDRKTFNKVSLPAMGYTELFVTVALEAGHFWAHYGNQETFQKLAEIQHDINAMGGSNLNRIANGVKLRAGEIVLAWFEEEYYRAEVIAEGRVSNKDCMVKIFFLDYGNVDVLPRDQLRHCPERFRQLPYQAFECYLCEIHPVYGDWTDEANIRFRELTQDKKMIAKVYSVVDNSVRLDLYLPDEHVSGNSNHVNQILVDEGFARKCEESYSSKLTKDNSVRMERAIKESNSLLSKLDKKPEAHEVLDYDATKVKLRGPFNPFEMSFYSLTNNGRFRATNIEKDSVNSVFICEEPQDKHPRFMVSAVIGVNATGNTLIARETTVMPNIHGIASIVPVLFAPFAEYRLSKDKKRIIGAICGLGYMESSNIPILPEHDMEVTFDVEFTLNDVQMVNSVRKGINYAFKDADQWGTSALERIQRFSRKRILELLHHKRNETKQTDYSRPYVWNQIPELVRLKPADEDGSTVPLYALHYGVLLDDPDENKESAYTIKERQVRNLYGMAGRSTDPFQEPVVCPLCNVECRHPRALDLHLETRYHLQEEQILHSNSQSRLSSSSALR
eukprot:gene2873-1110_t